MTSLSLNGYGIYKESLSNADLELVKKQLTVEVYDVMSDGKDSKCFTVYQESKFKIYVPKNYGIQSFGLPDVDKTLEGHDIDVCFNGTLRNTQVGPVDAFLKACRDPYKRGGIINLPCAAGKTVIALYILSQLKKKTLIVVHKEFLLDQWLERIQTFLPSARVGIIKAQKCVHNDCDIVIASLQSLSMKNYSEDIFKTFGFVIVDEVHRTGAEVFSRVYRKVNVKYSLGLSATIRRKDGLSKVFKWHIGDVVYKGNKSTDMMQVVVKEYFNPSHLYCREHYMGNNKLNVPRMINNICDFRERSEFIVSTVKDVLEKEPNRKTLILSDRRNHLEQLQQLLADVNISAGLYYGGIPRDILLINEQKQVLLGTFAYVSEGFDLKGLNTMILASPKSDVVQAVGRILRDKKEDREYQPLVIDIVDKFSIFPSQAAKRIKYYNSQGYDVVNDNRFKKNLIELVGKCYISDEPN